MLTRGIADPPALHGAQPAGHRREERHFGAVAQRPPPRRTSPGRARSARARPRASTSAWRPPRASSASRSVATRGAVGALDRLAGAERLAQRCEIAQLSRFIARSAPPSGRKRTVSPRAMAWPAGLSTSAVGPDRRGQHARALVREQVQPAVVVEAHAQELAAPVGPRPVEIGAQRQRRGGSARRRPAARAAPAAPAAGR